MGSFKFETSLAMNLEPGSILVIAFIIIAAIALIITGIVENMEICRNCKWRFIAVYSGKKMCFYGSGQKKVKKSDSCNKFERR